LAECLVMRQFVQHLTDSVDDGVEFRGTLNH